VERACERFERDLAAAEDGTGPWEFRADLAEEPMVFAGLLPNIKGPEAGKPLRLMGWQRLIFTNLFDLRSPRMSGSGRCAGPPPALSALCSKPPVIPCPIFARPPQADLPATQY
jgi:hypothetical protein